MTRHSHSLDKRSGDLHLPEVEQELPATARRSRPRYQDEARRDARQDQSVAILASDKRPFWAGKPSGALIALASLAAAAMLAMVGRRVAGR